MRGSPTSLSSRRPLRGAWIALPLALVLGGCQHQEPALSRPNAVAVTADGALLVVDKNHYRVARLAPSGHVRAAFGGLGREPENLAAPYDIALGPGGEIHVSDRSYTDGGHSKERDGVKVFSPDGQFLREVGGQSYLPGEATNGVYGLDVDSAGNVYIADYHRNRIRVYGRDGSLRREIGRPGDGPGELEGPNDVAVDEERGLLYVVESLNARVQQLTLDGEPLRMFGHYGRDADGLSYPQYVALGPEGTLYVTDMGNRRIQRYAPDGTRLESIVPFATADATDWQLMGITVRPHPERAAHEILAVDTLNNRILVFDEEGRMTGVVG